MKNRSSLFSFARYVLALGLLTSIAPAFAAEESQTLAMAGIKILEKTESAIRLQFREETPVLISKKKFSSIHEAQDFCTQHQLTLQDNAIDTALVIAMSGAANIDQDLKAAIIFEIQHGDRNIEVGLLVWQGPKDQLLLMANGSGTSVETLDAKELREALQTDDKPAELAAAFCSKK